ncbi:MAG: glycosyltransferase, partial [Ignavibacteriaceae bacterium]|nr:glycosyltransferase [Ignavibacteriaceae bacterium]
MFIKLSIVIVNYNSKKVLEDCLNSITKSHFLFDYQVLIIDNASTEKINDLEAKYNNFSFILNNKNVGFAAANNIGIRLAKGKYILLLNPDTIVNQESFEPMIEYLESHEDVGVVGPKIFNAVGDIERSTHSFASLLIEFFHGYVFFNSFLGYISKLIAL